MERLREDYVDGEQFYDDDLNLICHNVNELDDIKQGKLIAGDGIEISGDTISVTGGTGGAVIDDTVIATDKTWSSSKIKEELDTKQDKEIPEPLCFTAQEANSTIGLERLSSYQTLQYSTDLTTWSDMTTATTITLANIGDSCYIRGVLSADNTDSNYTQFKMTGKIAASGNCNALWGYENPDVQLKQYCGYNMFYGCTSLTTAPELPATTLAESCYNRMFQGCTSLTTAPELPATILDVYCYQNMFWGCTSLVDVPSVLPAIILAEGCYARMFEECNSLNTTIILPATVLAMSCYDGMFYNCGSLTTAPELPATTLANYCYYRMFYGCGSLTTAPELPATTLANGCYNNMFQGCKSLTTAPELPATTLATTCYNSMFQGCTGLNYIKCLAINGINQNNSTDSWVSGVASSGAFVKESTATGWTLDNVNGIPSGWSVYNHYSDVELDKKLDTKEDKKVPTPLCFTAQETNSTIGLERLSSYQTLEYSLDLSVWNPMTTATTITLANSGDTVYIRGILSADNTDSNYTQFKMTGRIAASGNCNALWNYENPDVPLKQYCGYHMFCGCGSLTEAPELPATTLANYCYNNMFLGCTSLTTAPELPATTLPTSCYRQIFQSCTSLTTAPELPATTLANYCYYRMFYGCTSLTTAPELPATTLATSCYNRMFQGCTSLTTAPELPATTLATTCYNSMFQGCKSLTTAPELPATTLASSCYNSMFQGCTGLNYIKCLAINGINQNNSTTTSWVDGVASSGTFVKESTATGWTLDDVNGIPSGWSVYNHYSDVELDKIIQQLLARL